MTIFMNSLAMGLAIAAVLSIGLVAVSALATATDIIVKEGERIRRERGIDCTPQRHHRGRSHRDS